jgi:poly(A) polymerase Pap1
MGYLNGIAIMIMVAYVMGPIYLNHAASSPQQKTQMILLEFFRLYSNWDWSVGQI